MKEEKMTATENFRMLGDAVDYVDKSMPEAGDHRLIIQYPRP